VIRRLLLVLASTTLLVTLAGCGDDGGGSGGASSGEQLYRENCATCHATDGGGALGPSLKGIADRMPRDEHVNIVVNGKGQMPAWKDQLSRSEIDAVVDYERTLE
jgi:cytochrome c551